MIRERVDAEGELAAMVGVALRPSQTSVPWTSIPTQEVGEWQEAGFVNFNIVWYTHLKGGKTEAWWSQIMYPRSNNVSIFHLIPNLGFFLSTCILISPFSPLSSLLRIINPSIEWVHCSWLLHRGWGPVQVPGSPDFSLLPNQKNYEDYLYAVCGSSWSPFYRPFFFDLVSILVWDWYFLTTLKCKLTLEIDPH